MSITAESAAMIPFDQLDPQLPKSKKNDAIGDTASITLLTGLPGSGKTLRLIQYIVGAIQSGEHVYVCNINSIAVPGVTPWDDPRKWQDLPAGSVLVVDEAQDFYPARRGGDPEKWMREFSRIRHYGVRLVVATQQPDYLDTYLRGLVGFHEHLLRSNGKDETFIFRNNTVMDVVRKPIKQIKKLYDHERWRLPSKYFVFYKSAELHTVRYRMPALLKKALVVAPIAAIMFSAVWFLVFREGYQKAYGEESAASETASPMPSSGGGPSPSTAGGTAKQAAILTADEYAQAFTELVPGRPWSAPAYVNRPVRAEPDLFCMASEAGPNVNGDWREASCKCVTEQGTTHVMEEAACRAYAMGGRPYNPYREPDKQTAPRAPQEGAREQQSAPQARTVVGIGTDDFAGQQARYGQLRGLPVGQDPQEQGL